MSELTGKNVFLESVKPSHHKQILLWSVNSNESYFILSSLLPKTSESLALELHQRNAEYFMVYGAKEEVAGLIKAYNINEQAKRADISFILKPSGFNMKYYKDAVAVLVDHLSKKKGINNVFMNCLSYENDIKKVLVDADFVRVGAYKEHLFFKNKYVDLELYRLQAKGD